MQVRLRLRQHEAGAGELDRRRDQLAPRQRREPRGAPRRARRPRPAPRRRRRRCGRPATTRASKSTSTESISASARAGGARGRDGDEVVETRVGLVGRPVDEHEPARARPGERALGDPGREGGSDAGVDGVSAVRQHLRARFGGERMACGDRASHGPKATRPTRIVRPSTQAAVDQDRSPSLRGRPRSRPGRQAQLTAVLVWLGPPGSRPRRARLPADAVHPITASPSGTTSGTRAATASSPTASSTTRSRRSSGSSCSRSRPSRRRRSRSRSCSGANGDRARAGRAARSPIVWAGIVFSAAFPFALGAALALLALWRSRPGGAGASPLLAALTLAASPLAFLLLALSSPASGSRAGTIAVRCSSPRSRSSGSGRSRSLLCAGVPEPRALPVLVAGVGGGAASSASSASR